MKCHYEQDQFDDEPIGRHSVYMPWHQGADLAYGGLYPFSNVLLDEGHKGFEGGMNARKYVSLTGASKATATRDLQDLVKKGVFAPIGGGRSTPI